MLPAMRAEHNFFDLSIGLRLLFCLSKIVLQIKSDPRSSFDRDSPLLDHKDCDADSWVKCVEEEILAVHVVYVAIIIECPLGWPDIN